MTVTNIEPHWSPFHGAWQIWGECRGKRVTFGLFSTREEALAWWRGIDGEQESDTPTTEDSSAVAAA